MKFSSRVRAAALVGAFALANCSAQAQSPDGNPFRSDSPLTDERCGGVLAETHAYNREGGPQPGLISPAQGWYHYGFPVSTYRWGWFGAEHYYPTVWCHTGYYRDCYRIAYRCGY